MWKDKEQILYVDGQSVAMAGMPAPTTSARRFVIAGLGEGNDVERWGGPISNVLTYDRVLSRQEIDSLAGVTVP